MGPNISLFDISSDLWEIIATFLPFIIPLAAVQFVLMITALVHAVRHPRYKRGNQIMWVVIILFVNLIGPILYFIIGKGDE